VVATKMTSTQIGKRFGWIIIGLLLIGGYPQPALADEDSPDEIPNRYGLQAIIGNTYDPDDSIGFVMLSGFALFDYEKIWPHSAPEALRFKVEVSAGSTWTKKKEFMASAGIFALYYLDGWSTDLLRPYIEGGINAIYTDWRVEGQGSNVNFNPQAGMGMEFSLGSGPPFLAAVRLHHISNANLDDDNRGVNSVVFVIGRFF